MVCHHTRARCRDSLAGMAAVEVAELVFKMTPGSRWAGVHAVAMPIKSRSGDIWSAQFRPRRRCWSRVLHCSGLAMIAMGLACPFAGTCSWGYTHTHTHTLQLRICS